MTSLPAFSRRHFLTNTGKFAAAAVAAPYLIPSSVLAAPGRSGANGRVTVGVIGLGGRARQLMSQLPAGGQIASVADCFLRRCEEVVAAALTTKKVKLRSHQDHRKLLEEKDIDAVIVGTHDHGRVLPCIHACQAKKDVYAEKPLTVYIREGRVLVNAARKYKRVFQVGTQQRSMEMNQIACEFVRSAGLGKIKLVRALNYTGPTFYQGLPEQPAPEGLNWDAWIGATEMRPYNQGLQFGWMRWWDYSGGEMTNWGAHGIDQIQCALGMDSTGPVEVWPIEPLQRDLNGPVAYRYANGVEVRVDDPKGPHGGGTFRGEKGNMYLNRNDFRTNPPDMIKNMPSKEDIDKWADSRELWTARYHLQNWLDCIKTRQKPISDVEIGHRSISVCHLVNIARQIGRKFQWDPEKEQIIGDDEANKLISRPRRKGYELPEPL